MVGTCVVFSQRDIKVGFEFKMLRGITTFISSENIGYSLINFFPYRRCSGCRKRRSLRANSFFEEFPKVALGKLLLVIYFFAAEDSQRRISRHLGLNAGLVSNICRKLQDVCSRDLEDRPFTPFGGTGTLVKCEESKFNHKPKVTSFRP